MRIVRQAPQPAKSVRILGVDPSLTSTGWCYRDAEGVVTGNITTDDLRGPYRLRYIRAKLEAVVDRVDPTLVVYEGYAMGIGGKRSPGRAFDLGELGGVLKTMLWERGHDIMLVSPTLLKKVIVGRGGSKKEKVEKHHLISALQEKFGLTVRQHDQADACGLMLIGEIKSGAPTITKNARELLRLDSIEQCELIRGKMQSIAKKG